MTDATPLSADSLKNIDLWQRMNAADGWHVEFSDDSDSYRWMKDHWAGSDVEWTWEFMHRPVLRADLWRYLKILHTGGVYTDIDASFAAVPKRALIGADAPDHADQTG